ncbi:MAG TPA: undecaprenyl/decaprenyl-phosphate alpha-N-acetylglucosaminyl 1-phosphate transferase [Anaerolineales bacterium]|nr:undecaprenyl/decaprenyl-phosphate alpha-N-acetylglucosaminyl 1-phosphate transferase [Anaerolineae bacterium]HIQ00758.1 undecaprenyl/decaprenyl-phosphate alpha-N-acetylglucosaminyl 1-phosphate transferase [Anaerolineales bacterium]
MDSGLSYLTVFTVAALSSVVLAPLSARLGRRLGVVDRPGGRRIHKGEVSRLGGVALFLAFAATVGVAAWQGLLTVGYKPDDFTRLKGLLIGGLVAFLFGLVDDRFDLSPGLQLLFQFTLSLVALATLLWLESFTLPFFGYVALSAYPWGAWVYVPLTVLWVMGMMNTVNWLDGLDGLAAGVGAILCLVLAVHMHRVGQPSVALLPLALLGALVGFLPYNVAPSRVFLGSGGAFFLGYALSGLGLIAGGRVATVLLVMGLPIVDVAWQIFDRVRHRRSPAQADRGHLHYRLLDLGLSQRTIVLVYWAFCGLFGLLALSISSRLYKLIALLVLGGLVVLTLAFLSRRGQDT